MSFPTNLTRHRMALLEMLGEAFRDPAKRSVLKTRGISMRPLIRERDDIVIRHVPVEQLGIGDIIAYRFNDALIVHRIVAAQGEGVTRLFYEKGDNNLYLAPVRGEQILGTVVELGTGNRRLDLRSPAHVRLGQWVARYGLVAVRVFCWLRDHPGSVLTPGRPARRAGRTLVYALLQAPPRTLLWLGRALLSERRREIRCRES